MLKLSEIRNAYERSSNKLGEISRQLCFAGFAVVWIFNRSSEGFSIPEPLYLSVLLWCVSMMFDILQYVCKTGIWYLYYLVQLRGHKKTCKKTGEVMSEDDVVVDEPEAVNVIIWICFVLKVMTMVSGYFVLGRFLINHIIDK